MEQFSNEKYVTITISDVFLNNRKQRYEDMKEIYQTFDILQFTYYGSKGPKVQGTFKKH